MREKNGTTWALAAALLAAAILSFALVTPWAASAETHEASLTALEEKQSTVLELAAASTAASAAITLLPGDAATPIAEKLADLLRQKGCPKVTVADLARCDMAEALEDAFRYGKIVLAASTYNAGIMPFMEDFLHHLKAKNYQKRTVGLMENGSWAPFAVKGMTDILSTMKEITILPETVTLRGPMKESDLPAMEALASALV